jgi:hypothetical protein
MADRGNMRADVVVATDLNGNIASYRRDRLPDLCPRCHHNQQPVPQSWNFIPEVEELHGVFRCTNSRCERIFIAEYEQDRGSGNYFLRHLSPNQVEPPFIPKEVAKVSPMYVEIVRDAFLFAAQERDSDFLPYGSEHGAADGRYLANGDLASRAINKGLDIA